MGKQTGISWTDHTFNPWWGCLRVSEGCVHCYAETFSHRLGLNLWGPGGKRKFFGEQHWNEPLAWDRAAKKEGVIRRVFCASMADVFEDAPGLEDEREKLWELIKRTPNLEWLLLTKRPENLVLLPSEWIQSPPENVRVGITIESQAVAGQRLANLVRFWGGKNFISVEPMLGPVSISEEIEGGIDGIQSGIDWVIIGGESGAGCRPMDPRWALKLVEECKLARVPVFMKQLGGHPDKRDCLADFPEALKVREFPRDVRNDPPR